MKKYDKKDWTYIRVKKKTVIAKLKAIGRKGESYNTILEGVLNIE